MPAKFPLNSLSFWAVILLIFGLQACNKIEQDKTIPLQFEVPKGWPEPFYQFEQNPVSEAKFSLGRKLFYDVQLSITNTVSCGTCHQPFAAFAQLDHDVSHGIYDRLGKRNTQALFNLNWAKSFFWDGRANHLEIQPLSPIIDSTEMGETIAGVVLKLQNDPSYRDEFSKAWGDTAVSSQRIFQSLAVFMGMMISDQSKYDQYLAGNASLTASELSGLSVFEQKCNSCHKAPLFSDFSFRNNGLALQNNAHGTIDSGLGALAPFDPENLYKFKVPSLRNLKYTRPYMHDGRFTTLDQVLEHYASVSPTPNLDPILNNGISLTTTERTDLLAFLNTLNDEEFVRDSKFHQQ